MDDNNYVFISMKHEAQSVLDDLGQRYVFKMYKHNGFDVSCRIIRKDAPTILKILEEEGHKAEYSKD